MGAMRVNDRMRVGVRDFSFAWNRIGGGRQRHWTGIAPKPE
jgi:hypothetical protein